MAAHCNPDASIERCIRLGVRSIEHGTLIEDATAKFAAESDVFIVPTMALLAQQGAALSLVMKNGQVYKNDNA